MTTKAAFSPEEWKVVLEGPPTAGMVRRSTSLAVATFFSRFAITASTVTASWLSCQTS